MGTIYKRGRKLWVGYKEVDGKRVCRATPFTVGQERQAEAWLAEAVRAVAAGESPAASGPLTVAAYFDRWARERAQRVKDRS